MSAAIATAFVEALTLDMKFVQAENARCERNFARRFFRVRVSRWGSFLSLRLRRNRHRCRRRRRRSLAEGH